MKAVILAAGEGLRCRPLTLTRSKVMLPVANKPIIEHVIRALAASNINDLVLVVGYKKERVMDYFGDGVEFGVNITYVHQKAQLGTAHAIKLAKEKLDDRFLVLNGDNLIEASTIGDMLAKPGGDGVLLAAKREETTGYGVVVERDGKVERLVEKPRERISNLVNTGIYLFTTALFDEIDRTPVSEKGEYMITDTIQRMIEDGYNVRVTKTGSAWLDAVHSWDLLRLNASVLERCQKASQEGTIEDGAVVRGSVSVGRNTIIRSGAYIIGPAAIGCNCDIGPNSTIHPSTSIGDNSSIGPCTEIQNCILMNDVHIGSGSHVADSIIGSNNNIGPHFVTELGRNLGIDIKGSLHFADELGTVVGDDNTIGHRVLIRAGKMVSAGCVIEAGAVVSREVPQNSIVL